MAMRTPDDLINHPCLYKLKDFDKAGPPTTGSTINNVKKMIPKLDENGNVVYKKVTIPVSSGCACKGNKKTEYQEKLVPEMVEITEQITTTTQNNFNNQYTICKLFGTVKRSICENCKTYKRK